jgi:putative transposase
MSKKAHGEQGRAVAQGETLKATSPYAANIHSHILQVVVADLDKAFQNFFRRVKTGETPGYHGLRGAIVTNRSD